jgi:hypothetical protein
MILQYNGKRQMFVYKNIDFSTGKAEVDDDLGKRLIEDSNGTFTLWVPPTPKATIIVKDKPKATPKLVKATPTKVAKKAPAKK